MITVNIEIREANTMEGVNEFRETLKDKALDSMVEVAMDALSQTNPKAVKGQYYVMESEAWKKLPKKLYWFKETADAHEGLCALIKEEVGMPQAKMIPIYLLGTRQSNVPKIVVNITPTMSDMSNEPAMSNMN